MSSVITGIPWLVLVIISVCGFYWWLKQVELWPTKLCVGPSTATLDVSNHRIPPVTFLELLKTQVPSLLNPFASAWWLPGKHFQTFYCSLGDFSHVDPIRYDRKYFRSPDGGIFTVDITPPISERPLSDGEPVLIALHGLTGGSHESYVRTLLAAVTPQREDGGLGMRGLVMNFRGCAGSPVLTKKLYHAGSTEDLRALILWLSDTLPGSPYYAIGFSLGSNVLVKYCGEEGDGCPLTAALCLANIWDYYKAGRHIESGSIINRYVYDLVLGDSLRNLIRTNLYVFKDETRFSVADLLSRRLIRTRHYCDVVNSQLGGFKDADDYYIQVSSFQYIGRVRIPLLAINARDDPISCEKHLPVAEIKKNQWVILAATTGGGHLGWFEAGAKRWYVTPVKEFLEGFLKMDMKPRPRPMSLPPDNTGIIRQAGCEVSGYAELSKDSVVSEEGVSDFLKDG